MLIAKDAEDARRARDQLDADFKAGRIIIDNGWLVEVVDGCTHGCPAEYGHQPGCGLEPLVDLVRIEDRPVPIEGNTP